MLLNRFQVKKNKNKWWDKFVNLFFFFYLSTSKHGVSKNSARLVTLKPRSNDSHKPLVKQYSDHLESKPRACQPIATFSCCSHCVRFPYNITLFSSLSLFLTSVWVLIWRLENCSLFFIHAVSRPTKTSKHSSY
jgi:hypothetical protein